MTQGVCVCTHWQKHAFHHTCASWVTGPTNHKRPSPPSPALYIHEGKASSSHCKAIVVYSRCRRECCLVTLGLCREMNCIICVSQWRHDHITILSGMRIVHKTSWLKLWSSRGQPSSILSSEWPIKAFNSIIDNHRAVSVESNPISTSHVLPH